VSKDIFQQLNTLKNDPRAGAVSEVERLNARTKLMQAISIRDLELEFATTENEGFFRWSVVDYLSAPLSVAILIFVIGVSGWFTTVSAAGSLPGDQLYSVKIATEKAMLTLASQEHKAILHTEFAERRLEESEAVLEADGPDAKNIYRETLNAFKIEIALASEGVQTLYKENSEDIDVQSVAEHVDKKIAELNTSLRETVTDIAVVTNEVKEAQIVAEEISNEVETAIVEETVKVIDDSTNQIDVSERVRDTVNEINQRKAYLIGRLSVIDSAIQNNEDLDIEATLSESDIEFSTEKLSNAMDSMARGGYENGFETLHEIEMQLSDLESRIVDMEVEISTAFMETVEENNSDTEEVAGGDSTQTDLDVGEDSISARNDDPVGADSISARNEDGWLPDEFASNDDEIMSIENVNDNDSIEVMNNE